MIAAGGWIDHVPVKQRNRPTRPPGTQRAGGGTVHCGLLMDGLSAIDPGLTMAGPTFFPVDVHFWQASRADSVHGV
jgi:hypothetical protein